MQNITGWNFRRLGNLVAAIQRCAKIVIFGMMVAAGATPALARPELTLHSRTSHARLLHANPSYPHPSEPGQVFFLQRNMNANTVVYAAQFDAEGKLHPDVPVSVYWRRYADQGQIMPLRWYERIFGFGMRVSPTSNAAVSSAVFNALKSHKLELRQSGPFQAGLWTRQNNRDYRLIYGYLDVDQTGLLPKVTRLRLYTNDPQTGLYVTHVIAVSGGAFNE